MEIEELSLIDIEIPSLDLTSISANFWTESSPISLKTRSRGGAPSVMTKHVLDKLREAFLLGCSDGEACIIANISARTLYYYQGKHPEYLQQKEQWKQWPCLKARQTIVGGLDKFENAFKYMERKKSNEFGYKNNQPACSRTQELIENLKEILNTENNTNQEVSNNV